MSNYEYVNMSYSNDLTRIKIPKFQRSLVWTHIKKKELILTLHKNFPFGALLVAPSHDNPKELRLLDGQQRLSTINDYANNQVKYWREINEQSCSNMLKSINEKLKSYNYEITQSDFDEYLNPDYELADWTDEYDGMNKDEKSELREIVKETRKKIKNYIELDKLQIPVIKFIGDEKNLPEVFENLNKGGVPLTKYEVLSAAWDGKVMKMPENDPNSDEILNNVKEYYLNIVNDDNKFEIDDFSEDDITESRSINLAEFGRALGKFVVKRIPTLVSRSENAVSNELGFGLLGIISDTPNKDIVHIDKKQQEISKDMTANLRKIDSISQQINTIFDKLLKQNIAFGTKKPAIKSQYSTGLSTSFKNLSYFAALWNADEKEIHKTLANIPAYYVSDSLTGVWTAHGDQRLQDYYPSVQSKDYLVGIDKADFKRNFDTWINDNFGKRKTFSKETKALITIHSNLTYFATKLPDGEDFEFEHIIPKAKVLKVDPSLKTVRLSNLGNGMFLPKSLNQKKVDKTLYEYFDSETKEQIKMDYTSKARYPKKDNLDHVLNSLSEADFQVVNKLILDRAKEVEDDIINGLSN